MNNRILIISIDEIFIQQTRKVLEELGIEILVANDGIAGFNKARESEPGVIIMEITLPYMNGYHVSKLLKNDDRFKAIPIVFISGDDDNDTILNTKRAGGDLFIRKPIQTKILLNQLLDLLSATGKTEEF
jgi:CheY-like chemotaxis protein